MPDPGNTNATFEVLPRGVGEKDTGILWVSTNPSDIELFIKETLVELAIDEVPEEGIRIGLNLNPHYYEFKGVKELKYIMGQPDMILKENIILVHKGYLGGISEG